MVKDLWPYPNEKYLHEIEDELYEYAVAHPEEYIGLNLSLDSTDEFLDKLTDLYSEGKYHKTYMKILDKVKRADMDYEYWKTPIEIAEWFVKKHPQWKELYYYDDEE
ncbi:hypothetical protein [Methanosphaera sp.]|uniref:hypothetical protein n=1 Tax=Methanosphaera sp. TaxID=2666342 RepID=UPI0026E0A130|nr:hypothetical protein [Methanosphaera sp.]MDO5822097.1 hypothetical protein [Methanosphaera sp.]